jgi:3-dehydroquinate dehydratase type I
MYPEPVTMAIVACISERNAKACVTAIKKARLQGATIVEPRMDFLGDKSAIAGIIRQSPLPVMATCRKKCDGGAYSGPEDKRLEMLELAIAARPAYVDVELELGGWMIGRFRRMAQENGCRTIVSKHSGGTPSMGVLVKWMEKAAELGDIVKIVTTAESAGDCVNVLRLLRIAESRGIRLAAFAMGEPGKITRVASLMLGSPFAYCPLSGEVAPGQMTIREMRLAMGLFGIGQSR